MTAHASSTWLGPVGARSTVRAFLAEPDPVELAWRALSAEIIVRDGRRCRRCSTRRRLTVHHITPREYGGTDVARNLLTLCGPCHDRLEVAIAEGVPWFEVARELGRAATRAAGRSEPRPRRAHRPGRGPVSALRGPLGLERRDGRSLGGGRPRPGDVRLGA